MIWDFMTLMGCPCNDINRACNVVSQLRTTFPFCWKSGIRQDGYSSVCDCWEIFVVTTLQGGIYYVCLYRLVLSNWFVINLVEWIIDILSKNDKAYKMTFWIWWIFVRIASYVRGDSIWSSCSAVQYSKIFYISYRTRDDAGIYFWLWIHKNPSYYVSRWAMRHLLIWFRNKCTLLKKVSTVYV